MCYHPIRIVNRSRSFSERYSPIYYYVPCGKCEQCRNSVVDEYFLRTYAEWRYNNSIGGSTLFITLTYNNDYLPVTNNVRHFDSSHIRTFFCELRTFMKRKGLDSKNLRYFLVSEYGAKYKRPHYHAILFFPYHVNSYDFINLQQTGFIQRAWKYGFSSYSKKGAYVNNIKALSYCCKYLAKFEDFYSQYGSYEIAKQHTSYKPFHRQSKGYGLHLLNMLTNENKIGNFYLYHEEMQSRVIPLPRYIQRKLYYTYDKVNCLFRLNSLGIQVKAESIFRRLDLFKDKVNSFLDGFYEDIQPVKDEFLKFIGFDSLDSLYHHFQTTLKCSVQHFVNLSYLRDYVNTGIHNIFGFIADSLYKQSVLPIQDSSPLYQNTKYVKHLESISYAHSPSYLKHGDLFYYLEVADYFINHSINNDKRIKRKSVEYTKEFFNNLSYGNTNYFITSTCA